MADQKVNTDMVDTVEVAKKIYEITDSNYIEASGLLYKLKKLHREIEGNYAGRVAEAYKAHKEAKASQAKAIAFIIEEEKRLFSLLSDYFNLKGDIKQVRLDEAVVSVVDDVEVELPSNGQDVKAFCRAVAGGKLGLDSVGFKEGAIKSYGRQYKLSGKHYGIVFKPVKRPVIR